jgi:hypothetical protein
MGLSRGVRKLFYPSRTALQASVNSYELSAVRVERPNPSQTFTLDALLLRQLTSFTRLS